MDITKLYGENISDEQFKRAEALFNKFTVSEGKAPEFVFSSPGRAEILGNHTDHNHGKVMVASINCDILCFASSRDDDKIILNSEGYPPIITSTTDSTIKESEYGTSLALVKGVCSKLREMGYNFKGFTAHSTSNIFKGAGVSSSAAFEVLICEIINVMYLENKLDPVTKAVISQYSENVYFGKPCGILDQSGIAIGSLTKLDFNNPEKPEIKKMTPPKGYTLVLTNTGGDHAKLTEHYAAIRSEMENVAEFFGKKVLRDVDEKLFIESIPSLKKKFSSRAILRAMHFYNENKRVDNAENSLESGNSVEFLKMVKESGLSSLCILQNCYVPGDTNQPVVLAIEYSNMICPNGFFRVHGGGFAGSILGFVKDEDVDNYIENMSSVFGKENVFKAFIREKGTFGFKI